MNAAAQIRLPDSVRDTLFEAHFEHDMEPRAACAFVRMLHSVTIPDPVAEALIREEAHRRKVVGEAARGKRIVEVVEEKHLARPHGREPNLVPSFAHEPRLTHARGKLLVGCSCGGRVGRFDRDDVHVIEVAWFRHRDGGEHWKNA